MPDDIRKLCEGWRAAHPDHAYACFSRASAAGFLDATRIAGVRLAFERAVEPAMKADIFRLAYLFFVGGFYLDADDRCLAPLTTIDTGDCDLIIHQEDYGTVGNNFLGAAPRHPAIGMALAGAIEALNRGDADVVWLATGPGLLTRALARHLAEDLPERLARTRVLQRHELRHSLAMHCASSYKLTGRHWIRSVFHRAPGGKPGNADREPPAR